MPKYKLSHIEEKVQIPNIRYFDNWTHCSIVTIGRVSTLIEWRKFRDERCWSLSHLQTTNGKLSKRRNLGHQKFFRNVFRILEILIVYWFKLMIKLNYFLGIFSFPLPQVRYWYITIWMSNTNFNLNTAVVRIPATSCGLNTGYMTLRLLWFCSTWKWGK